MIAVKPGRKINLLVIISMRLKMYGEGLKLGYVIVFLLREINIVVLHLLRK